MRLLGLGRGVVEVVERLTEGRGVVEVVERLTGLEREEVEGERGLYVLLAAA